MSETRRGQHEYLVLVLDDEEGQRTNFVKAIERALDRTRVEAKVETWIPSDEDLEELDRREKEFRELGYWDTSRTVLRIDRADVLVLDWDLLFLERGYKDAEPWAYETRCFSTVGPILMVNRWNGLPNPFDLGLRGDPFEREDQRSFADLEIGHAQLGMSVLWHGRERESGDHPVFRPWYWPVLTTLVEDWRRRVDEVTRTLMETPCISIRRFLDFDEESWRWLPRKAMSFFAPEVRNHPCAGDHEEPPYLIDLLLAGRGWSYKHQKKLYERLEHRLRNGKGDKAWERTVRSVARPIAGLLGKWLEWLLLPEQDVLVDAPHLVERFPSLLKDTEPDDWQSICWRRGDGIPSEVLVSLMERLEAHSFLPSGREFWISRPVWRWRSVREDESIPEVKDPWGEHDAKAVGEFFEDTSRFGVDQEGRSFEADVESAFAERFVEMCEGVNYVPESRLLS